MASETYRNLAGASSALSASNGRPIKPVDAREVVWHFAHMKREDLPVLIRNSDQNPVRFCMNDGKTYTLSHPDFAAVADDALILLNGPGHELGNVSFVICYFDQITRVERLSGKEKAA
jgi:hypothetical protein